MVSEKKLVLKWLIISLIGTLLLPQVWILGSIAFDIFQGDEIVCGNFRPYGHGYSKPCTLWDAIGESERALLFIILATYFFPQLSLFYLLPVAIIFFSGFYINKWIVQKRTQKIA